MGATKLAGKDVITTFRLLKNSVKQRTGLNAYMLISCDALRKMELMDFFTADEFHSRECRAYRRGGVCGARFASGLGEAA